MSFKKCFLLAVVSMLVVVPSLHARDGGPGGQGGHSGGSGGNGGHGGTSGGHGGMVETISE